MIWKTSCPSPPRLPASLENQPCGRPLGASSLPSQGWHLVGGAAAPRVSHRLPPLNGPLSDVGPGGGGASPGGGGSICVSESEFSGNHWSPDKLCQTPLLSFWPFPLGSCFQTFVSLLLRRLLGISDTLLFSHLDRLMPAGPETHRPGQSLWQGHFQDPPKFKPVHKSHEGPLCNAQVSLGTCRARFRDTSRGRAGPGPGCLGRYHAGLLVEGVPSLWHNSLGTTCLPPAASDMPCATE